MLNPNLISDQGSEILLEFFFLTFQPSFEFFKFRKLSAICNFQLIEISKLESCLTLNGFIHLPTARRFAEFLSLVVLGPSTATLRGWYSCRLRQGADGLPRYSDFRVSCTWDRFHVLLVLRRFVFFQFLLASTRRRSSLPQLQHLHILLFNSSVIGYDDLQLRYFLRYSLTLKLPRIIWPEI